MAYNDKILQLHRYSSQKSERWTENMANKEPPSSPSRWCDLSFCFLCSSAVHKKQKFSRRNSDGKKNKKCINKIYSPTLGHLAWSNEDGDVP